MCFRTLTVCLTQQVSTILPGMTLLRQNADSSLFKTGSVIVKSYRAINAYGKARENNRRFCKAKAEV